MSAIDYPECLVQSINAIGNGKCDNFGLYNTEKCGWDGGDCISFNEKYPNCTAQIPDLIGDGSCNNLFPYYSEECGWDEDDCETIISVWIGLIGLAYIILPLMLLESRRRMRADNPPSVNHINVEEASNNPEPREERRERILTSIIHKQIISSNPKKNSEEDEPLHQQITESKSKTSETSKIPITNEKKAIPIENLLWSIRESPDLTVTLDDVLLFSPASCPVCCEDYEIGDQISISKNGECHHTYHVDCILQWLMDNDECPMCRCNYLEDCPKPLSITNANVTRDIGTTINV